MTTKPNIVRIAEAAQRSGVATRTLRRWIANGTLTGYRFGPRLIKVDMNEVEALLRPVPTTPYS